MKAFGGFYITGGTTVLNVPNAGKALTGTNSGLTALASAGKEGEASISESATTGRATCVPGKYLVSGHLSLEGEFSTANSGDAVGVIESHVRVAGSVVTGSKAKHNLEAEGQVACLPVNAIVEITEAQRTAGTNYIEVGVASGDLSGNDVIIREAVINIVRLD
jgi:hypothetical protein